MALTKRYLTIRNSIRT